MPSGYFQDFLAQLTAEERRRFDRAKQSVRIRKGQTIIGEGVGGTDVFFVEEGALQVILYSKHGKEVSIRNLNKGDCFGELAALDLGRRSANVVALTDGRLIQLGGPDFKSLLEGSPRASLWLARYFAAQIRALTELIFELSALNVRSRLHAHLLRLVLLAGVNDGKSRIYPSPTHAQLANRIGTNREGVSRAMSELESAGVLTQSGRELVIMNFAELSRLVRTANGGQGSAGASPGPGKHPRKPPRRGK